MDKMRWLWSSILLVSVVAFAGVVFAADGVVDPAIDPSGTASQFWTAVAHKQWGLAAVIGTMLFVAFVRFVSPKIHGPFGAWIQQSRVSAALAFLGGALSALSLKLLSGLPWSTNLIGFGFTAGLGAIGGYNAFWDLLFPSDKKKDPKAETPAPKVEMPPPLPPPPGGAK